MTPEHYTDASRREWHRTLGPTTNDDIQTGCLQRIAAATEKMARSYGDLIEERDRYKRYWESADERLRQSNRRISALRGTITRMRNAQSRAPRARRKS